MKNREIDIKYSVCVCVCIPIVSDIRPVMSCSSNYKAYEGG